MSCYTYEHVRCSAPIFRHVRHAVILRMADSERDIQHLFDLCAETIVQTNKGFQRCSKDGVVGPPQDLVHAYKEACRYTQGLGDVLILEDDAEFMQHDAGAFEEVDDFIHTHGCNAYTLGSMGRMVRHSGNHFRIQLRSYSHAIVWSESLRNKLLEKEFKRHQYHIDNAFLYSMQGVFTYKDPLMAQRLVRTANQEAWCLICSDGRVAQNFDGIFRAVARQIIRTHNLDASTNAWEGIYKSNRNTGFKVWFLFVRPFWWIALLALVFCAMVAAIILKKRT